MMRFERIALQNAKLINENNKNNNEEIVVYNERFLITMEIWKNY